MRKVKEFDRGFKEGYAAAVQQIANWANGYKSPSGYKPKLARWLEDQYKEVVNEIGR